MEQQAEDTYTRFEKELASINGEVVRRFPVRDSLHDIRDSTICGRLSYLSRSRRRIYQRIESSYGPRVLSLYLKLTLCCFIISSLERMKHRNLPDEIPGLYHEWFERVLEEISRQDDDHFNHRDYYFTRNAKVCSLVSIPVGGAWMVDIFRVALRPLVAGGLRQSVDYLRFVALKARGISPFFQIHTVARHIGCFTEDEMNLCYLRIARLMKLNPRIKGIHRRSWFLDPKLEQVSPDLVYLRKTPQQNGAGIFRTISSEIDTRQALAMSPHRRKLYAEGKYLPTPYAYIWPRRDFLEWADKTNAHLGTS